MIRRAEEEGPQRITKRGKETVVVVSMEEWSRKTKRKGSLAEFFANSPLRGLGLKIERLRRQERVRGLRGKVKWEGNLEESRT
jgi:prevent-host-death family protein